MLAWSIAAGRSNGDCAVPHYAAEAEVSSEHLAAAPRHGMALVAHSPVARGRSNIEIFDFELSEEEMQQISAMGSASGRLTDFGFAPKWD